MGTEAEGSSMFFDPISLEEVSSEWAIKIKNETFNIHTLLDWMANDTDFGVQAGSVGYYHNPQFINPATAKPFSTQEVKQIYEFGQKMGLISNKYCYFEKHKNKKAFLKAELDGTNEDFSNMSSDKAKLCLKDTKEYLEFLEKEIPSADELFKQGEKISSLKGKITRKIGNYNSVYSDLDLDSSGFNDKDLATILDYQTKINNLLDIRFSWNQKPVVSK